MRHPQAYAMPTLALEYCLGPAPLAPYPSGASNPVCTSPRRAVPIWESKGIIGTAGCCPAWCAPICALRAGFTAEVSFRTYALERWLELVHSLAARCAFLYGSICAGQSVGSESRPHSRGRASVWCNPDRTVPVDAEAGVLDRHACLRGSALVTHRVGVANRGIRAGGLAGCAAPQAAVAATVSQRSGRGDGNAVFPGTVCSVTRQPAVHPASSITGATQPLRPRSFNRAASYCRPHSLLGIGSITDRLSGEPGQQDEERSQWLKGHEAVKRRRACRLS